MKKLSTLGLALCLSLIAISARAQVTTGTVKGIVTDPNGAVVTGAKVTIVKKSNNETHTGQTSGSGTFQFDNLLVGDDYTVTVESTNFKKAELTDVRVQVNQATDLTVALQTGAITESVTVTAGGTELVDTTTANLSKSFGERQVVELAQTSAIGAGGTAGVGVNNLSLLAPGVTSSGGVGVGTGGSVGGQRPRNNNFVVDGVDNNDKAVTGPQSYISPEEVAEFTLLQNQFSAEFARSNGGNFITVTKSGTNDFHGTGYTFWRNRYLNALDTIQKNAGINRDKGDPNFMPRSDFFRGGFNIGGPVYAPLFGEGGPGFRLLRNKLFFFTSYERLQHGSAAGAGGIVTPTAEGFAIINSTPGLSATNRAVFNQFVPVAPVADIQSSSCKPSEKVECVQVGGRSLALGSVNVPSPNFFKQNHAVINFDLNQSSTTFHHWRFGMTNGATVDNLANLPIFFTTLPLKQRLFSYTLIHHFSQSMINETRLAFRRSTFNFQVPGFTFPGLDSFPNIDLDDLGLFIGPDGNAPQFGIENNYQIVDNVSYSRGTHSFKFGGDFRKIISPQHFVQRERGEYEYINTEDFLRDIVPEFGERNAGGGTYYGDQKILYAFAQDDWRIRSNLTLNLGVAYSYQQMSKGSNDQALNSIASVPGLIVFDKPKTQTKNFAPKVGFAYSPNYNEGLLGRVFGSGGKSSIRAGFSMGYDYIFDNLWVLSSPPQLQQTRDCPDATKSFCHATGFLAAGGIPGGAAPTGTAAEARAATTSFIPDQEVPYSLTWTGSYQRQFRNDWAFELRYVGTRGIHLITQNRINVLPRVSPEFGLSGLPTYISGAPTQAQIDALPASTLTLAQIQARPGRDPVYTAAGFTSNIVAFLSNGNSTYHGGSTEVTKRFSNGFQMTAAYTFSHLIDDTTAEVFSTVLSPRRVEDFQNLRRERASSALDHRHRFVTSWIYELPWWKKSNGWTRTMLSGINIAGVYTYETGERITVRSGTDANQNGDSAGDRAILNPGGTEGVGSTVSALLRSCAHPDPTDPTKCLDSNASRTIGYVANNPNAKYIQAGLGAVSTIGRNTFLLPPINNFDISLFKNFRFGESKVIQVRADFFNAFNHPQYVPGSVNTVDPIATTGLTTLNQIAPLTTDFLNPGKVLSSNPRVIQMALRFNF
jgi:carboxypeptidase family protein